jgi:peroxiredoxin
VISRRAAYITLFLLVGAGAILLKSSFNTQSSEAVEAPSVLFEASDFSLPLYNAHKTVSLSDYKGKTIILNFWASWCVSCRLEAPGLEKTWQAYKNKEVVLIGINLQESPGEIQKFVKEYGITYPVVIDKKAETVFKYGIRIVPTTVFINKKGLVVYVYEGLLNEEQLISLIKYTASSTRELA